MSNNTPKLYKDMTREELHAEKKRILNNKKLNKSSIVDAYIDSIISGQEKDLTIRDLLKVNSGHVETISKQIDTIKSLDIQTQKVNYVNGLLLTEKFGK